MRKMYTALLAAGAMAVMAEASAQVTFYEREGFQGGAFTADRSIGNFERFGFNDRASSVIVDRGRWEMCEDARFTGRCVVLGRGQYPSLAAIGLNNRVSSVRPVRGEARAQEVPPPPTPQPYAYYPRHGEQTYTATVTSVRAVVGPPEQRCWVERQEVVRESPDVNVPGAIVGGVIGGILGHQIGGGHGKDVATGLGAIGGAAIGSNVGGGGGSQVVTQDVQRCREARGPMRPSYWDVTYTFRGREHHAQMSAPPGATISVNRYGEPRM